jgi:2-C-methyl-D-erythritol 4-phosphate cytidylyltransferase
VPAVKVSILLLASGRGTRLGAEVPKAYVALRGRPLVLHTVERLRRAVPAAEIVLAVHPEDRSSQVAALEARLRAAGVATIVDGGATRQDSMRRAFAAADPGSDLLAIHDAARPFPPVDGVRRAIEAAARCGAALLAVPSPDTLKRVADARRVTDTLDRAAIWLAQTPQVIRRDRLVLALAAADRDGFVGTDDVSLCEHAGLDVEVVLGDRRNLKVTTPDDLVIAEALSALEENG